MAGAGTAVMAASGVGGFFWKSGGSNQPVVAGFGDPTRRSGIELPVTPCPEPGLTTASFAEGPFYSPKSPFKSDLRDVGWQDGDEMVLTGRVLDPECRPIAGAVLDFWQVDDQARYDNAGFRYRGHVFSDVNGAWQIRSIHPTSYTLHGFWTTAHLHVKVQGPDTGLLTTQLFFPRAAEDNAREEGWTEDLQVVGDRGADDVYQFRFDFVLERRQ